MKMFFRFAPLSLPLPLLLMASLASPALASDCKKIHATIVDAQVTEGCTSPNRFCAAGSVKGNHGLNGTTYFVMDGAVRGPATAPGSLATSGILIYTTDRGTLTVRESGLSGLQESGQGYFTAFQEVLSGTGEYEGSTGHFWVLGEALEDHFESEVTGVLCE
jgi:hypothetical protein